MKRKVIHFQIAKVGSYDLIIALCDDGTMWARHVNETEWKQLETPP